MARFFILLIYVLIAFVIPAIVGIIVLLFKAIISVVKKERVKRPQKENERLIYLSKKKQAESRGQEHSEGSDTRHDDEVAPIHIPDGKQGASNADPEGNDLLFLENIKKSTFALVKREDEGKTKEVINSLEKGFARTMTLDDYRELRQKKPIISDILRDLSNAAERNQAIDSLLEEVNETQISTGLTFDWKQDLMEYLVIQHGLGNLKNRYSALQNATFVAGVLVREYMDSTKNKGFFDYIMDRCREMQFSSPLENFAYGLNADIVTKMKAKESSEAIYSYAKIRSKEYDSVHRPHPEDIYPLPKTGDAQMDRFAKIAIELTHTRLRHLRIQRKDVKEAMAELSVNPIRREYHNFSDYFSHAFQFGYLTERRFQRLYFLLYNIAQSISLGCSDAQIRHQIDNLYVVGGNKRYEIDGYPEEKTSRSASHREILEPIPYSEFNEKEHHIISVAARVSREHCEHPKFKKTAKLAIDLINQYHTVETDSTEKNFFSVSITLLKRQKPHLAQAYSIIASITNHIFEGKDEHQTYLLIKRDYFQILSPQKQKPNYSEKSFSKKEGMDVRLKNDLMNAVFACRMRKGESQCLNLMNRLHASCNPRTIQSSKEYYSKLRKTLGEYRFSKGDKEVARVVDYILYCKLNGVSDVSLMALVGTKFPTLYNRTE